MWSVLFYCCTKHAVLRLNCKYYSTPTLVRHLQILLRQDVSTALQLIHAKCRLHNFQHFIQILTWKVFSFLSFLLFCTATPSGEKSVAQTEVSIFQSTRQKPTCRMKTGSWEKECWISDRKKMTGLIFFFLLALFHWSYFSLRGVSLSCQTLISVIENVLWLLINEGRGSNAWWKIYPGSKWGNRVDFNTSLALKLYFFL